jgi:hypothetical protein
MKTYKIQQVELIKAKGKEWKKAIINAEGVNEEVSVWPGFSQYDKVEEGNEVSGAVQINGQYRNLIDENRPYKSKAGGVMKAMDRKESSIRQSQTHKDGSIRISSTARDATLITVMVLNNRDVPDSDVMKEWKKWRQWLYEQWDKVPNPIEPPF